MAIDAGVKKALIDLDIYKDDHRYRNGLNCRAISMLGPAKRRSIDAMSRCKLKLKPWLEITKLHKIIS